MANEVVSTYERVDQVIATFSRQVSEYLGEMNGEIAALQSAENSIL